MGPTDAGLDSGKMTKVETQSIRLSSVWGWEVRWANIWGWEGFQTEGVPPKKNILEYLEGSIINHTFWGIWDFFQVFFLFFKCDSVEGPADICRYLFDTICLVHVESFKGASVFVYAGESTRDSCLAR